MKRIDAKDIDLFEELTLTALGEKESAAFVAVLMERERVSRRLTGFAASLEGDLAQRLYNNEIRVIQRLEEERTKLMGEIDLYSQSRKARRSYSSRFPFPPPVSFFDTKEKK